MEIFSLDARHLGEPLDGARLELRAPGLHPERHRLLRAVIEHLTRKAASADA